MKKIAFTVGMMALLLAFGFAGQANASGGYIGTGIGWAYPGFDLDHGIDLNENGAFSWEMIHAGYNFTDNLGVSVVWGGAGGTGHINEKGIGASDMNYAIGYIDLNLRLTAPMEKLSPYAEVGVGNYAFAGLVDKGDVEINSNEANLGYRAAVGAMIPIGKFYLAPEFAYNWVDMGEFDVDGHNFHQDMGNTNFGLLLLKAGYSFGGK